ARKGEQTDSTDRRKARKHFEDPDRNQRHRAGEEEKPRQHQKAPEDLLDRPEMAAEASHRLEERLDRDGGEDEGNTEAERIDEEQAHALAQRIFARGDSEQRR